MPDAPDDSDRFSRLEQALAAWLDYVDGGTGTDPADFLQTVDPGLRPLLEPMLAARPQPAPAAPNRIGTFRIVRALGRGGMGTVYEAEDEALERRVALKILGPQFASSPASLERFRREGAAVARLQHPGIVEVHGIGAADGLHWIAMELVDGANLADLLRSGAPLGILAGASRPAELAEIGAQVAEALDYAHAQSVVHRDIKPHNILIGGDGRTRIVDFGLAKLLDRESLSTTGEFAGSLAYASPEQLSGSRDIDARTDVWSLGVVLYEGLHGSRPFEADTHEAVVRNILARDPAAPDAPRDLQTICLKALDKDPAHRFASAGEMAADLRRFLDHQPIHAVLPGTASRLIRYIRRRRSLVVAVAASVLFGTLAVWFWIESREQAGVLTGLASSAQTSLAELERAIRDRADPANPGDIDRHRRRVEGLVREAERLVAMQPDHPELVRTVARAHDQAGQLYQLLKLDDEALAAHGRGAALLRGLLRADPNDLEARCAHASCLHNRHVMHRAMGRDDLAAADLEQALADWQLVIDRTGDTAVGRHARRNLATALTNRARNVERTAAATVDLDRAAALWNSSLAGRRLPIGDLIPALETFTVRAGHDFYAGRTDDARRALDRVIDQITALGERSGRAAVVHAHADARIKRAEVAANQGDAELARADLELAVTLRQGLAADGAADHVVGVANAQTALAALLIHGGIDLDRSATLLLDSRSKFTALAAKTPGLVQAQHELARIARFIAHHKIESKAPAAATEAALREALRRFRELRPGDTGDLVGAEAGAVEGLYGAWLREQGRHAEACTTLSRALDTTTRALAASPRNPIFIRDFVFQSYNLLTATNRSGRYAELEPLARRLIAVLPLEPAILRMSVRALDRAIAQHPGPHATKNRFARRLVASALRWIAAADAAGIDWRLPDYADSLVALPRHPELGPRLRSAQERTR